MQKRHGLWVAMCLGLAYLAGMPARAAESRPIDVAGLLTEMVDLSKMTEFPDPPYTCKQFSSYDRASKSPQENWFANNDCGQYLRVETRDGQKEYVMADMAGPGAIVRIWSANPKGSLRIYIDGQPTPVIDAKMTELLGGKFAGLPAPIACELSKGWNLYFPIPYAKSCKVTSTEGGFYYHVNYRTYPAGTAVTSFTLDQLQALKPQIEAVAAKLAKPLEAGGPGADATANAFEMTLAPGQTITSEKIDGPNAIAQVVMTVTADDRDAALRGVLLKGTFDGEQTIEAPLGDLFGSGPGINPYTSLPLGMSKEGQMTCNWRMPFKESAQFELRNCSKVSATLKGQLVLLPYKWTNASMHLHAKWRAAFDVSTDPKQDWNYLAATGKGVFAGVAFGIDNPVKDWWGEGDEKIYVDGETFPSHFGTGTEDYYGYAWCSPQLFTHAYHNQPRCDGPGNFGRTSVNRWHILDRIPFTRDFKFDMELWHWKKCNVNLYCTGYWYALPGATDNYKPIQPADLLLRPAPELKVQKVPGAIEGEQMKVIRTVGAVGPQDWDGTSSGRHMWWHQGQKPGDTLVLGFNVPKAGKYKVAGRFLKAVDYGIHQLAINGQKAGEPIDFFNNGVVMTDELTLGVFDLKEGQNEISATVVGANAKAAKAYMFGLDYLILKPAE